MTDYIQPDQPGRSSIGVGGWPLTILLCLVFSTFGAFWLSAATLPDMVAGLCEAVPPIPAVATLVFFVLLRFVLRHMAIRFGLSNAQILVIYAFVSVSVSIGFINLYRKDLVWLAAPEYVVSTRPGGLTSLHRLRPYLPEWIIVSDPLAAKGFWQGAPSVPWGAWLAPLATFGGMLVLFYLGVICMMRIFYKRWSREERLIFPVAELPLNLVEGHGYQTGKGRPLFSDRVFWFGMLAALIFNLFYIVPAILNWRIPPTYLDVNKWFAGSPTWRAGGQWQIRLNPIIFGLGYFVSLDILLSAWLGFLLLRFQAMMHTLQGAPSQSLFHIGELQGTGAYTATAIFLVWAARRHILAAVRRFHPRNRTDDDLDPGPWAVMGALTAVLGLFLIFQRAGMVWWLAALLLLVMMIRALVMTRIRAQAGMPIIYLHVGTARNMVWLMGGAALAGAGMRAVATFTLLGFITEASYLAPHHADAFRLAERGRFGTRRWALLALLAVVFGFLITTLAQLPPFYHYGALNVGEREPVWQAGMILAPVQERTAPEALRLFLAGEGFVITAILTWFRRFYWFPFHPIGYVVACAVGYRVFAPVLAIWLIKWFILRYFGGKTHRRAKVFFLGLVLGHFTVAALWALLASYGWEPTRRYFIGFW